MSDTTDTRQSAETDDRDAEDTEDPIGENQGGQENLIKVYDGRPEGYEGTCLRPLGLCDLGGCCESCWYSPDHPRHIRP